jgi:YVTN family beta-propeller protein
LHRQFFSTFLAVICLASFAPATTFIQTFKVGRQPTHIGVNIPTNKVYVDNVLDNTVSVIDLNVFQVTATVPLASQPAGLAVNQAINRYYVSIQGAVAVYDGVDNSLITTIAVSGTPSIIAINPNNNFVYVQDVADNEVHVIDGTSDQVIAELPVSHPGNGIVVNRNDLYAITQPAGGGTYSFSLVDETSGALLNQIPLQGKPGGVIAMGISNSEVITNDGISNVDFMIQNATGISCRVQVGRGPAGMGVFQPASSLDMVVANRLDNTVALLSSGATCH